MKKNAFTLIELLAVIAILAIILVISIPKVLDVIEISKINTFKNAAKLIVDSAEKKYTENEAFDEDVDITCEMTSKLSKKDYEYCFIKFDEDGNATVTMEGKGKYEGIRICNGSKDEFELSDSCETDSKYFTYKEVTNGIEISGYNIEGGLDVIVPKKIDGKDVVSFGTWAFKSKNLTNLVIPDSVTNLGTGAFNDNKLPDSQAFILNKNRDYVNSYGGKNKNPVIPDGIKYTGYFGFSQCYIESVTIPDSVIEISVASFRRNSLTSVDIPNSVKTIGSWAFAWNPLTNVVIPDSVTSIGGQAFQLDPLTSVTIGNSVKTIGDGAFAGCQLTSVTIPESVTSIGNGAFNKASNSNPKLTKIINKTGKSFDWGAILNSSSSEEYTFAFGTVVNSAGNVEIVSE